MSTTLPRGMCCRPHPNFYNHVQTAQKMCLFSVKLCYLQSEMFCYICLKKLQSFTYERPSISAKSAAFWVRVIQRLRGLQINLHLYLSCDGSTISEKLIRIKSRIICFMFILDKSLSKNCVLFTCVKHIFQKVTSQTLNVHTQALFGNHSSISKKDYKKNQLICGSASFGCSTFDGWDTYW